jgi:hypothetical protein
MYIPKHVIFKAISSLDGAKVKHFPIDAPLTEISETATIIKAMKNDILGLPDVIFCKTSIYTAQMSLKLSKLSYYLLLLREVRVHFNIKRHRVYLRRKAKQTSVKSCSMVSVFLRVILRIHLRINRI